VKPARGSPRFWAITLVVSAFIAVACIPTVLVFEYFRWWESPVHGTAFCACIVSVLSAVMYLILVRRSACRATVLGFPARTLAYTAIALAGGFLLFVAAMVVLVALSPSN
jgi:hypothetical protein